MILRVKIGAFFSISSFSSLRIERVHLDFSDSLLPWNSPCSSQRLSSCSISDDLSVTILQATPGCECRSPTRSVDTCQFHHPLSLIHSLDEAQSSVALYNVSLSHIYSFYNSLLPADANISIFDSALSHISICGSVISSHT